ncbi:MULTISPECIES: adenylate/guanylate cyclase domain-containing protein [Spirulina sp. CCY15215]|uniref:adenylate/guanylate cyclase domain-containing protein n=1 Tax=Spirulina sp. CCY15215 TaxID=2767591 RepID=UPI00194EE41B|nr:adenylate/guanylate cyclase domain-containing protein [Spirulina major]
MDSVTEKANNLLIVDDTPANLRLLSTMLGGKGYKVRSVMNGQMAIKAAQAKPPDLVLLDINMPQMNGYEVCTHLKEDERTRDIPVIFLSALDDVLDKIKAFTVGGVDYITKPFHLEEVLIRVQNHIALKEAKNEIARKSEVLEAFSNNLKALHRLDTTEYQDFTAQFADYLATGCKILGFPTGVISKIEGDIYTIKAARSPWDFLQQDREFALKDTFCIATVKSKSTSAYDNISQIPELVDHPYYTNYTLQSYLGTPIWVNGKIYGTLNFSSQEIRVQKFEVQEKEIIELMAQSLGKAIAADQIENQRREAVKALQIEQQKSETLLLNILPQKIAKRLKQAPESIAEQFDEATILFADIVGFTQLSTLVKPLELVSFLNQIFSAFDKLALELGVEKIKTVGDAYMLAGGLPVVRENHVEAIADAALAMLEKIKNFHLSLTEFEGKRDRQFEIRIGIHLGSVVAGVLGTSKFSYDLWGDTVNVASRMESTGEPGKIQVTEIVYEKLKDLYLLEKRGLVEIKGKGEMVTYWLLGKNVDNKQ